MKSHAQCSFDNCPHPVWNPWGTFFSRWKPFCVFHSPLFLNRKRGIFAEEWEKLRGAACISDRWYDSLNCRGFVFPISLDLNGAVISGESDFSGAIFTEGAMCEDARFDCCDFTGARFASPARFNNAVFSRDARFTGAQFMSNARFSHVRFMGDAPFNQAVFHGPADFNEAQFTDISFHSAHFQGTGEFTGAAFSGDADFSGVRFDGNAFFNDARFSGEILFEAAQFAQFGFFSDVSFSNTNVTFPNFSPGGGRLVQTDAVRTRAMAVAGVPE